MTTRAATLVAFALLCATLGPGYVTGWDYTFVAPRAGNPSYARAQLWFFLVGVQAAAWSLCLAFLLDSLRVVWNHYQGPRWRLIPHVIAPTLLPVAVLLAYQRVAGRELRATSLAGFDLPRVVPFAMFGTAIALFAVAGMFLVRGVLLERRQPLDVAMYLVLKSQLNTLLSIAAMILSLGILATAVLRSAMNAERGKEFFPADYVVMYGGIYTLLLLVAYVPVKATLWSAGSALVGASLGEPPTQHGALAAWLENKGKIENALNLDVTSPSALIGPIAVVLPLLSSWVSVLAEGAGKR